MRNKKFVIALLVFIFMMLSVCKVYAANSFSANLVLETTRVAKGSEVKVTLKLSRLNVEGGVSELTAVLDYDGDVLSISKDDVKELNDWSVSFNEDTGKVSFEKQDPIEEDEELATFTFKVAENTQVTSSTIKLREIEGGNSSLDKNVTISPITQTITLSSSSGGGTSITSSPSTSSSPTTSTSTTPSTTTSTEPTSTPTTTPTTTTTNGTMPDTGSEQSYVLPLLAAIGVLGIVAFLNYKKLDNDK